MNTILQINEDKAKELYPTASPEFKTILEDSFGKEFFLKSPPNFNKEVIVAGITWLPHLTPSNHCKAPSKFNKETGLWYFDQKTSAPLHAFEQNLCLATKEQYLQLYNQTTQRIEKINGLNYMVFKDRETNNELWEALGGYYSFASNKFYNIGIHGYLWSSSVYNANNGFYLYIHGSYGVIPRVASYRACGFPVRCVKK